LARVICERIATKSRVPKPKIGKGLPPGKVESFLNPAKVPSHSGLMFFRRSEGMRDGGVGGRESGRRVVESEVV